MQNQHKGTLFHFFRTKQLKDLIINYLLIRHSYDHKNDLTMNYVYELTDFSHV